MGNQPSPEKVGVFYCPKFFVRTFHREISLATIVFVIHIWVQIANQFLTGSSSFRKKNKKKLKINLCIQELVLYLYKQNRTIMKYLLKFVLQTLVIMFVVTPVFIAYVIWEWKLPDTEIYRLYHRSTKRFVWVMGGKYQPKMKPSRFQLCSLIG